MPDDLGVRPRPTRLPLWERSRLRAGLMLGDAAALASRLFGRGSGASIRGHMILRLYPEAFATLLQARRIASVTGTNGKTSTSHLLSAAVRTSLGAEQDRFVTNTDGANLHFGIVSALSSAPASDIAVVETDERVVADLIADGHPEVLVMLNISRDQLDRNHEIASLARAWKKALIDAGDDGPTVVANAGDPLVVWAASAARRVVWVRTGLSWLQDSALCPECGQMLRREARVHDNYGAWLCSGCDVAEPEPDYVVSGESVRLPDGSAAKLTLNVPGRFNIANAACALAAAHELGVSTDDALAGFTTVQSAAGRFAVGDFDGHRARLLLSKNPAGWAESLLLVDTPTVVLAIDSLAADGRDVSWLWDVDYEQLQGRHVVCTGPRAYDLAVRLAYAEVDHEVVVNLAEAIRAADNGNRPVDVIATYTPFRKLLKMAGLS